MLIWSLFLLLGIGGIGLFYFLFSIPVAFLHGEWPFFIYFLRSDDYLVVHGAVGIPFLKAWHDRLWIESLSFFNEFTTSAMRYSGFT